MNKTAEIKDIYGELTNSLLRLLKNRVEGMNVVGFFIAGSGRKGYVKKDIIMDEMNCSWEEAGTYLKEINKNKVLTFLLDTL